MMASYKIIDEAGTHINTIVADADFVEAAYPGRYELLPEPPAPEPEPEPFADLTRRQVRLALLSIGITREDVNAQIGLIEDAEERAYSMIEWEDANSFKRHHPLVDSLAIAFTLPTEQVDDLWRWAAAL